MKMFVCGPTVYDYIHIGNARTFVVFDVVAKWLRYTGEDLEYIQNITDIEDKILLRAKKQGREPIEFAREWEEKFYEDVKALGITSPVYKRATDHIPEIKKQVQELQDKGNAYVLPDGIYFDLSTFPDYGKLSGRTNLKDDDAVSRIDENENKRNKGDFCIWKFEKPLRSSPSNEGEVGLPATLRVARRAGKGLLPGRPGWHIEDTAITEKYFGPQYDIHGGGMDLMFPHHEAEIAIMESISGLRPFVKKWMHVGFLVIKGERMGKSKGNFAILHEVLKVHSPEAIRHYLLSSHYRSPLDYNESSLKTSEAGVQRIGELYAKLLKSSDGTVFDYSIFKKNFSDAMNDDFNIPKAVGVLFDFVREANKTPSKNALSFLDEVHSVLGIVPKQQAEIPDEINQLLNERESARAVKNFELADEIRMKIEAMGWRVEDTNFGPFVGRL